jgi:hypothetical protein
MMWSAPCPCQLRADLSRITCEKAVQCLFHLICTLERLGPSVLACARPVVVRPAHMLFVLELREPGVFYTLHERLTA